jgi:hypothetical protein
MTESAVEHAVLQQIAAREIASTLEELTRQGWTVYLSPSRGQVDWWPEALRNFEPDYAARKGDEIIIGEIKSRNPRSLQSLDGLARAVAKVPNARLEVHWLGDIAAIASAAPLADVDPRDVLSQVNEARILLGIGHVRAAALIAWSAVEGALLYHAARLDIPLQEDASSARSAWQLLSYLDSLGYVNETDLKRLTELRSHRNAVAHFSGPGTPASREDTEYGLDFAERLLRGQYVSVDQMVDWYQNRPEDEIQVAQHELPSHARLLLEQNFPGARPAEIDEAVRRLYTDWST